MSSVGSKRTPQTSRSSGRETDVGTTIYRVPAMASLATSQTSDPLPPLDLKHAPKILNRELYM